MDPLTHVDQHTVSNALSNAHAALHHGHSVQPNEMAQLLATMQSLDVSVKAGFAQMDFKLNTVQESLNIVRTDVNHLKGSLAIVEGDLNTVKSKTIPELENNLKAKISALEQTRLESELYSKKTNLLFFNVPSSTAFGEEDTEATLCNHLTSLGLPDVGDLIFCNVHRLPSKTTVQGKPHPIIAKFVRMKDRNMVLNFKPDVGKLSVAPHLPVAMQAERRRLIPIRDKLKAEGKNAKIKVKGTNVQLMVNNVVHQE